MRGKLIFVAGAAIGYVLGSRAGHQRYDQIAAGASKLWNSRPVQKQVVKAEAAAGAALPKIVTGLFHAALWAVKKLLGIQSKPRPVSGR
ncbi:hypothetical protein GCM10025867_10240 [Frondihabitans sucicola]|uniref:YtxH domain-containing protein n=1 Tax=Frondihabitans sucicola TaxID=1268041 RepID=A0ABM8GK65_9MICO|nr:hypothetical protein [Frondihabitans sucicola]BDZ48783.1 hypothetical protein GCM10025867_10240 [Frondihabitans sucicola]